MSGTQRRDEEKSGTPRTAALSSVKLALLAQQVRGQIDGGDILAAEPIAIIGIGCRFPGGADSPAAFWRLLANGIDAVGEVPADRWDADALYDPDPYAPGTTNSRWGGFLEGIDQFDAAYFAISPREAARMDPQQRLVLEVAIEAFERAGQSRERIAGSLTGVFIAATRVDYSDRQYGSLPDIDAHTVTGTTHCIIANRVSYLLDLHGPSMAIDTACSSSLVAIHTACQSLRNRDSDMAIAGGVNVILSPEPGLAMAKWGVMSPAGRCKTFDASADGFVSSEGCGLIVLKRLSDAIADGDPVLAVVRGSAVNQDGRSTAMSAPNGLAQQAVVRRALHNGQVLPEQISHIEAHGTGTALGDPIEVEALAEVVGSRFAGAPPVALTSLKTNIGHLEAAAGVAGLIKVVLSLQHEAIPPHLHFTALNPHISLDETRFFIPTESHPWPAGSMRRLAGISAFGFGGTNAHVVVEEAPRLPRSEPSDGPFVLPLSAQNADALRATAARFAHHLATVDGEALPDVCYTAGARRTHHDERLAVVGSNRDELVERLRTFAAGEARPGTAIGRRDPGQARRLAFVFSGQGPQWWGMGRELLAHEPVFHAAVERCDELLRAYVDWSLLDELARPEADSRLDQTEVAQPALFALQIGLAALWGSWGVIPHTVVGHSVGEIAAAYVAGALTLDDAIRVVAHRSRLMQASTGNGAMASVQLPVASVEELIAPYGDRLCVAAINAPAATVISGEPAAMDDAVDALTATGAIVRRLPVNYAFHSPQMAPYAGELAAALAGLEARRAPKVRFASSVVGAIVDTAELGTDYWARNMRDPVRFADAICAAAESGCNAFLEVGPHPVLGAAVLETLTAGGRDGVVTTSLRRGRPERETMLGAVADLYAMGVALDWTRGFAPQGRVVDLPTYPWQRRRHWFDAGDRVAPPRRAIDQEYLPPASPLKGPLGPGHPLLGHRVRSAAIAGSVFESALRATEPAFLADHRYHDVALMSATAYLELALAAFAAAAGTAPRQVRDIEIVAGLALDADIEKTVQVHIQPRAGGATFSAFSLHGDDEWTLHASGDVSAIPAPPPPRFDVASIQRRCATIVAGEDLYEDLARRGMNFGPMHRGVERVWVGDGEALGRVAMPASIRGDRLRFGFHPALLDAALHSLNTLLPTDGFVYLPVAISSFRVHQAPDEVLWSHVRSTGERGGESISVDITIATEGGAPVAELLGFRLRRTNADALRKVLGQSHERIVDDDVLYEVDWQPLSSPADAPVGATSPTGPWLIIDDRAAVGTRLARALESSGARCIVVPPELDVTNAALAALLQETEAREVVYARGLDAVPLQPGAAVVGDQHRPLGGALAAAQAVLAVPARLWLLTRGAQAVGGAPTAPEQATLLGLGAAIAVEHPELRCIRIDLEPGLDPDAAVCDLLRVVSAPGAENQIALRGGEQFAPRLGRCRAPIGASLAERGDRRLVSGGPGILDTLELAPLVRVAPKAGEVEIRVHVTGLNFRDVLIALDLYPEVVDTFGEECSGEIVRVGPDVRGLVPGDRVLAMGSGSFASYVTTNADLAIRLPETMSFEAAATIPITFLTAHYALEKVGRLTAGERVLIHAAAGGVGMAAVQIAQRLGAEVYATAGSDHKRDLLRSLGVRHVFDSRSLDFADGVMAATDGRGVDVVLNSLSGDFIARTLDVLAPGGRFLEIGKREIWSATQVAAARGDVDYAIVFLGDVSIGDPPAIQSMLVELMRRFAAGELTPLPRSTFGLDDVVGAFRLMAQARHVGKVVVTQPVTREASPVGADGTYLITGGLGGIGLLVARRLVERGVRSLALVGRRAPDALAREAIDSMRSVGVEVRCIQADVAVERDVEHTLDDIARHLAPLRGIIHAAGVNDDATLAEQSWPHFEHVLAPKLAGGWHLHNLSRDLPLDAFVLFSSAAGVLGAAGQANYAAANAFLDALAMARRAGGAPGLSISWGPWDRVGMTAPLDHANEERMRRQGYQPMTADRALDAFERARCLDTAHVVAISFDRSLLDARPILSAIRRPVSAAAGTPDRDLLATWLASPPGLRRAAILAFVREEAAKVLGLASGTPVPPRQPFSELGLDSLMAVELRNAVGAALARSLPATLLFDYPTSDALVDYLVAILPELGEPPEVAPRPSRAVEPSPADTAGYEDVAALSEAEAEALLLAELGGSEVTS
ncbi:MAG: SDR family NAD(P)-dependent oxidoreductase [Acidimicrobiales bacterium]